MRNVRIDDPARQRKRLSESTGGRQSMSVIFFTGENIFMALEDHTHPEAPSLLETKARLF
jgi:regulator of extracellular matrix RemA (YlzA/DUF370 family)